MNNKLLYFILLLTLLPWVGSVNAQTKNNERIKVMCFNIRMSGEKTGYNAQPFANLILEHNPDVVALQEVDYNVSRSGSKDFLTEIASLTGLFPLFAKAIETGGGEYGVAILSKYPVTASKIEQLPFPSGTKEQRVALVSEIMFPNDFKLRFVSTHLDHSSDAVRTEMVRELNSSNVLSGNNPVLLGGDFNAKPSDNAIAVGMMKWKLIGDNTNTFPADKPTSKIDYIFGYPASKWNVVSYKVPATSISDHCPIVAEVEFIK